MQKMDPLTSFLDNGGRKVYSVQGDGNCLFRSLSHQLYGSSNRHFDVRSLLVRFENLNWSRFSHLLTEINSPDMQSHIHKMLRPGAWGTHVEIIAASTYFQVPVYFLRTPSTTYNWEVFNPLRPSCNFSYQAYPEVDTTAEDITVPDHFELLFSCNCHYDSITLKSGGVSMVRPTQNKSYTDCRDTVIE